MIYNNYYDTGDNVCPGCGYCRCCGRYVGPRCQPNITWCNGTGTTDLLGECELTNTSGNTIDVPEAYWSTMDNRVTFNELDN